MLKYLWFCILVLPGLAGGEKAYLGAALATHHPKEGESEIIVFKLIPGSGASQAGLKANDRILSLNGLEIYETDDIDTALEDAKPGDVVSVKIRRGWRTKTLQVTLGKTPPISERLAPIVGEEIAGIFSMGYFWFGFDGVDISSKLAAKMKAPKGILINEVFEDGPASAGGFMAGDIVVGVEGKALSTKRELGDTLSTYQEGQRVELEIVRDGKRKVLPLKLISLGDIPKEYRKDLGNYFNLNKLLKGAIELGEQLEKDLEDP